jgi:diguanylate cyclase
VSGFETVFLTEIDWRRLNHTVRASHSTEGAPRVPVGLTMEWEGSPAARMLGGGPAAVRDLSASHAGCELTRCGAIAHVAVPVHTPEGRVHGMLCGVRAEPAEVPTGTVTLFDLFARLLTEHVEHVERRPAGEVTADRVPEAEEESVGAKP